MITVDSKHKEWLSFSTNIYNRTQNRTRRAQSMMLDIEKTIDKYDESIVKHRNQTEEALRVNIEDIRFRIGEIMRVKARLETEIADLELYRKRAADYCGYLEKEALVIVNKCCQIRQNRQCVDLYRDQVDTELTTERCMILDILALMTRLQEQAREHARRAKCLVFTLNRDLRDKDMSVRVDESNAELKRESLLLTLDTRGLPIDTRKYTHQENTMVTRATLRDSNQHLLNCQHFRSLLDLLLKQTVQHLNQQKEKVDEAFKRKIDQCQEAKVKLENQHSETLRSMNDTNNTIVDLDKAIQDKRGYIMLAHSRLGNRATRPGLELVRDEVDARLEHEIDHLQKYTLHLQTLLSEAKSALRNLAKIQHELEENINVKSNSLKLDQVDCTVIRLGLKYNVY
uniref:Tektin n=1 Tax=Cacopsylla melanoneura TaxID=428564 RepID=A0A8D8YTA0_9HEMI